MADLMVLKFDSTYGATHSLAAVRALEELRYAWMDDVAVVEKHKTGLVTIHTPHGSPATGAWYGGLIGLLVLFWYPPAWFFGGWLAGLGIGAVVGEGMAKAGLDKKMIDEIKRELAPGTSALLLIGAEGDVGEMTRAFEPYHPANVMRYNLSDDTVAKLKEAFDGGTSSGKPVTTNT